MIILKQTNHWILLSLIWILTVISMAEPYAFARTKRPQGTRRDTLSSSCLEILAITPRIHKSQYHFSDFEFHQMSQLLDQYKIFLQAFKDPKFSGNQISAYFLPILDFHYGLTKHLVQGGQTDSFTHPIFFEHFKTMLRKLKELKSRLPPPNAEIEPFLSIKPPSTPSDVQLTDFLNHSEILDLLILNMESLIKRPSKINYKKVNSFFFRFVYLIDYFEIFLNSTGNNQRRNPLLDFKILKEKFINAPVHLMNFYFTFTPIKIIDFVINRIFDNIYFIEFSTKNIIYLTTSSYIVHDLNHATDSHRSSPINRSKTSSSEAKYIQHLEQTLLQLDFLYKFLPWFKNQLSPLEQEALSATLFVFIHEQIPRFEPDELNLNPEVLTHYLSNEDVVYNNCMSIPDKAIDIPLWYSEIKKGDSSGIKVRLDRIQIKFTEFLKDYLKNRGSETGN